jgi:hypothetical protein
MDQDRDDPPDGKASRSQRVTFSDRLSQDSQGRKLLPLVSIVANLSITEVEGHHLFLSHSGAGAGGVLTTTNL